MKRLFLILLTILLLAACAPGLENPDTRNTPRGTNPNEPTGTDIPPLLDPDGIITNDDPLDLKFDNTIPRAGDDTLLRGAVYLDSIDLLTLESDPLQFSLALTGNLPTPCNELRVALLPPDENNRILVDVYSLSTPDEICIQVLQSFSQTIPLGSFPSGHYTLWVNGEQVAEFDG